MARPKEVQAVFDRLNSARRGVVKATECAAEVDDQIGLRKGHKVELVRQLREVRDEAAKAVAAFDGPTGHVISIAWARDPNRWTRDHLAWIERSYDLPVETLCGLPVPRVVFNYSRAGDGEPCARCARKSDARG